MSWKRQSLPLLRCLTVGLTYSPAACPVIGPAAHRFASQAVRTTISQRTRVDTARTFASQAETVDFQTPVHIDESAVHRLQELIRETPGQVLRVSVDAGGCSGFQYVFSMDDHAESDDIVYNQDGVALAVDKVSYEFLKGATVEYAEDLMSSSFRVKDNPNSDLSCGCGSSFSAKMG